MGINPYFLYTLYFSKELLGNSETIEARPDPKIYHITSYRDSPVTYGKKFKYF